MHLLNDPKIKTILEVIKRNLDNPEYKEKWIEKTVREVFNQVENERKKAQGSILGVYYNPIIDPKLYEQALKEAYDRFKE